MPGASFSAANRVAQAFGPAKIVHVGSTGSQNRIVTSDAQRSIIPASEEKRTSCLVKGIMVIRRNLL